MRRKRLTFCALRRMRETSEPGGSSKPPTSLCGTSAQPSLVLDEVAADLEVALPGERRRRGRGRSGRPGPAATGRRRARPRCGRRRRRGRGGRARARRTGSRRGRRARAPPSGNSARAEPRPGARPRRAAAARRRGVRLVGQLVVAGADLLEVRVVDLAARRRRRPAARRRPARAGRGRRCGRSTREEPAQEARRLALLGGRELGRRLAPVAVAVGVEVGVVDARRCPGRAPSAGPGQPAAGRVAEQQRDAAGWPRRRRPSWGSRGRSSRRCSRRRGGGRASPARRSAGRCASTVTYSVVMNRSKTSRSSAGRVAVTPTVSPRRAAPGRLASRPRQSS